MEKTKVLITGVLGLFGSHFSRYLLDRGYEVYGIDNLSGGYQENVSQGVKLYIGGLGEKVWIAGIFELVKPDYVYHFAAYAAEGL